MGNLLLTAKAVTSQQFTPLKMRLLLCDVREHQGYYLAARRRYWLFVQNKSREFLIHFDSQLSKLSV